MLFWQLLPGLVFIRSLGNTCVTWPRIEGAPGWCANKSLENYRTKIDRRTFFVSHNYSLVWCFCAYPLDKAEFL